MNGLIPDVTATKNLVHQLLFEQKCFEILRELYLTEPLTVAIKNALEMIGKFTVANKVYLFLFHVEKIFTKYAWYDKGQCKKKKQDYMVETIGNEQDSFGFIILHHPADRKSARILLKLIAELLAKTIDQEKKIRVLYHMSYHDALTGLYNRNKFQQYIKELQQKKTQSMAIISIDVNGLKKVNDTKGHLAGDDLLRRTAGLLKENCCDANLFRTGGDEFMMILEDKKEKEIEQISQQLRNIFAGISDIDIAIGYAHSGDKGNISVLLHRSDLKMYEDKRKYYQK